jgi:hypothetical protein
MEKIASLVLVLSVGCGGAPFTEADPAQGDDAGLRVSVDSPSADPDAGAVVGDDGDAARAVATPPDAGAGDVDASGTDDAAVVASGDASDVDSAPACTGGQVRCANSSQTQVCGPDGAWQTPVDCVDQTCASGACVGMCQAGPTACKTVSGVAQTQVCDSTGTLQVTECPACEYGYAPCCVENSTDCGCPTAGNASFCL